MLAVVAEESRRWNCIIIGEDLGTVPEDFRATLSAWGVWSYLVVLFERNGDGSFRRPQEYPEHAIATFNTHDLPTFAGWMSEPRSADQARHRRRSRRDRRRPPPFARDAVRGAQRRRPAIGRSASRTSRRFSPRRRPGLSRSRSRTCWSSKDQVNVPGTVTEHPNWRRRWPVRLEELAHRSAAARASRRHFRAPAAARAGVLIELAGHLLDRVERRQAGLVAEMLDLVGRGVLGELQMLLASLCPDARR